MSYGIRDLARQASQVVDEVEKTGKPALITRHGRPVAALVAVDENELEDWILDNAPEFVRTMRSADREIAAGKKGRPLDEALSAIEVEEGRQKRRRLAKP
jgi:prevent-host-death family protein